MNETPGRRIPKSFLLILGVVLAACSASVGAETSPTLQPETTAGRTATEGEEAPDATEPNDETDSNSEVREAIFGGHSLSEAEFVALRDELIIPCMAEQGFEYVPTPLPPEEIVTYSMVPFEDRRAFVEEYGYGESTLFWGARASTCPGRRHLRGPQRRDQGVLVGRRAGSL